MMLLINYIVIDEYVYIITFILIIIITGDRLFEIVRITFDVIVGLKIYNRVS